MSFLLSLTLAWLELSQLAFASSPNSFDYHQTIPEKVLHLAGASEAEVKKIWGQPQLAEENKYFYEDAGYRYRLIVSFRQKKCRELEYAFLDTKFTLSDFIAGGSSKNDVKEFPTRGHDQGRFLTLTKKNKKGSWTFYFNTDSQKHLHHVLWEKTP